MLDLTGEGTVENNSPSIGAKNQLLEKMQICYAMSWYSLTRIGHHAQDKTRSQLTRIFNIEEVKSGSGKWTKSTNNEFVLSFWERIVDVAV